MLLDENFYGNSEPHWAVNLAGASATGMILNTKAGPEFFENTQALVGSVLAIERRR